MITQFTIFTVVLVYYTAHAWFVAGFVITDTLLGCRPSENYFLEYGTMGNVQKPSNCGCLRHRQNPLESASTSTCCESEDSDAAASQLLWLAGEFCFCRLVNECFCDISVASSLHS
jgi:hypothetical protein